MGWKKTEKKKRNVRGGRVAEGEITFFSLQ
jgi:hypothetical protein